jgi:hypothetical protein
MLFILYQSCIFYLRFTIDLTPGPSPAGER